MDGTRAGHAQVVVGRDDVAHVDIHAQRPGQFKRVIDDMLHVGQSMRLAKSSVAGQYLLFNELHDLKIHVVVCHSTLLLIRVNGCVAYVRLIVMK